MVLLGPGYVQWARRKVPALLQPLDPICLGLTPGHSAEPGRDCTRFLDVQT